MTMNIERMSLNQITIEQWSLADAVQACASAGVGWIAPWHHKVAELGTAEAARLVRDSGLQVSSLCRGGFFTGPDVTVDDNLRALEEAAELGALTLVLVCGAPATRDLSAARAEIAAGIERLVPDALACGVRLGIEPLHPMMVADRSAIVTLGEALDLAEQFDEESVGVIVDAYHVFWDPELERQLARVGGRVAGYHVSDWVTPRGDVLASRALPGDGIIDLPRIRRLVEATGYDGPVEVEVIDAALRDRPAEEVFAQVVERFLAHV